MKKIVYLFFFVILVYFGLGVLYIAYAGEGHDADYEWAQEHDIRDVDYNDGNSESFNEGVRQYAEEMQAEEEQENEDAEE